MSRLTLQDIAKILVDKNGLDKSMAESFATDMFAVIQDFLERDKIVKIKGLGTFKIVDVEPRESINVNTGERVLIGGHGKISFTPDAIMKELVNKPFSQFETVVLNDGVTFDDEEELERQEESDDAVEEKETIVEETMPVVEVVEETKPIEQPIEEPTITEQPIVNPPVEEEPKADEPEITQYDDEDESEESSNTGKWIVFSVVSFVLIILAACGGYIYGLNKGRAEFQDLLAKQQEAMELLKSSETVQTGKVGNVSIVNVEPKDSAVADTVKKDTVRKEVAKVDKVEPKPVGTQPNYESMDVRVRTGAYRIVGTMATVKVKGGETLKSISKAYLGEGMECYVEVFNGFSSSDKLKEGSTIKIPKLELKKRKKQ